MIIARAEAPGCSPLRIESIKPPDLWVRSYGRVRDSNARGPPERTPTPHAPTPHARYLAKGRPWLTAFALLGTSTTSCPLWFLQTQSSRKAPWVPPLLRLGLVVFSWKESGGSRAQDGERNGIGHVL